MANVTLFPYDQKPINFPNAASTYVQDGMLYFRADSEPNVPSQKSFTTNLPFVLIADE
jgi:hypothetical protein